MKPLILVGGGGHCKSVIEAAESAGYAIKGILDLPEKFGTKTLGYEVIGNDDDISKFVDECDFIVTMGFIKNASARVKLHKMIAEAGGRLATIVASTAHVSRHAEIAPGTVVLHHAMVNADAKVGEGCIINTFANIEHDAVVGDYSHISTGTMINGNCAIGARCFVGSGSVLVNGISITDDCIIGAGTVVIRNLDHEGIYFGNPVKKVGEL